MPLVEVAKAWPWYCDSPAIMTPLPTNKPPNVKPASNETLLPFFRYPMAPPTKTRPPTEKFMCALPGIEDILQWSFPQPIYLFTVNEVQQRFGTDRTLLNSVAAVTCIYLSSLRWRQSDKVGSSTSSNGRFSTKRNKCTDKLPLGIWHPPTSFWGCDWRWMINLVVQYGIIHTTLCKLLCWNKGAMHRGCLFFWDTVVICESSSASRMIRIVIPFVFFL